MWDEFYACLKLCNPGNVCVCVKCDVWSLKEAGIVSHKWCGWPLNFGIIMFVYNRYKDLCISFTEWMKYQMTWAWAGLHPIRTLGFNRWTVWQFKSKAPVCKTLSLPVLATRPPTPRKDDLEAGPLDSRLETNHLKSPRPCQSRNIAEPAANSSVIPTRLPGDVTQQFPEISRVSKREPPERHEPTHVASETKDRSSTLNSRRKRNQSNSLLNQQKASIHNTISISDWTSKLIWTQ